MSAFGDAMRRVITGDDAEGKSVVILDGGPSSMVGDPEIGGLFEIWEDAASGPLDPRATDDLGATRPVLGPRPGNVQVRWFMISPTPAGVPKEQLDANTRALFSSIHGEGHIIDQSRHQAMHKTHSMVNRLEFAL